MVQIIADSCSDLSPELIEKCGIDIVPLDVLIGETNYKDGVSLSTKQVFNLVNTNGLLPKTSAPSISPKLSSTYQSAL